VCDNGRRIPTDGDPCWWEEIISTTRLRLTAGVCVLSAGLFIGSAGGAIAWADTESTGSPAQSQGAEGPSPDAGAASAPATKVAHPLRTTLQATVQGLASTVRSLQKLGQQQSTAAKPAKTEPLATDTEDTTEALDAAVADPGPAAPDSNGVASGETVVASDSNAVPQASDQLAALATVVEPVTQAAVTVAKVALSVPGLVASLPTSATPVTDVITSVQEMLTTVTNAVVPLTQVPSDLISLLGVQTVDATSTVGGGVGSRASAPVIAAPGSQWLEVAPTAIAGGMALPANIAPLATLGDIATTGFQNELPASGIASSAQNAIVQTGLGSSLEHAVSALFVPASLSALAAVALPGVGGLLIICALGVRIGYRQAKALLEVRRAGIASFAGPGPLGVVRSGSLVALRPRPPRLVRPDASLAVGLLEQAA
jgi:hypothetical protein